MQPPLSMISSCIQDGKLSLRLMKVRSSPMAPPCTVQVSVYLQKVFQGVITAWRAKSCKVKSVTASRHLQFGNLSIDYPPMSCGHQAMTAYLLNATARRLKQSTCSTGDH